MPFAQEYTVSFRVYHGLSVGWACYSVRIAASSAVAASVHGWAIALTAGATSIEDSLFEVVGG